MNLALSYPVGKEPCPRCRARGEDNSGDNCVIYSNGGKYCFSCSKTIKRSDDLITEKIYSEDDFPVSEYTKEMWFHDKEANYSTDPRGFRGLKEATCKLYQVYHEFVQIDGKAEVTRQYYPISKDGEFSGVKYRIVHPEKSFSSKGHCKADCELFGQAVFRSSTSRWVVITSGEIDALSASQMLNCEEGLLKKDPATGEPLFPLVPVVSGTAGEASSLKQYKANYEFLNRFETIFIIPDKDDKGEEALHKVAQALPKNKLKVIDLPAKDANAMLEAGRTKDFVNAFWKAKQYSPAGILGSDQLYEKMLEKAATKKIEFPDFLEKLNEVTGGGMTLGSIVNITGGCYPADTEFFTGTEWKAISSYREGDSVLVYDKDTKQAYLDKPLQYVNLPVDQFYQIKNNRVDFITSSYHKHLFVSEKGVAKTMDTIDLMCNHYSKKKGNRGALVNTFDYLGHGINISDGYLRLKIAVFADGSFRTDDLDSTIVRVNLKKERKKERLRYLLTLNKLPYEESVTDSGYSIFCFKMDNRFKSFPISWYQANRYQFKIILEESLKWGNSVSKCTGKTTEYHSESKKNADFIQFVATSLGKSTSLCCDTKDKEKTCYIVSINNDVGLDISKDSTTITINDSGSNMYCFTTNTGFFVVRQKGQIYVSGNSGSGKSTLANEVVKHHILKKDFGVGIISLESDAGDYAENILSAYLQEKLHWINDPNEKLKYLQQDNVKAAAKALFYNADGTPSFHMIDERGDYGNLQNKIEELIISCDVQIILIDVLSDVFDGESMDFQSKWMAWEKATVKRYPVTFINVVHTRKSGSGQKSASAGGVMTEEDISGSSTQYKSASLNLIISRNKVAEDEALRNVMTINLFKNRQTGWTGEACQLHYDGKRHSFTELSKWFEDDPGRALGLGLDSNDPVSDMKHKETNREREKQGLKPVSKPDTPINRF